MTLPDITLADDLSERERLLIRAAIDDAHSGPEGEARAAEWCRTRLPKLLAQFDEAYEAMMDLEASEDECLRALKDIAAAADNPDTVKALADIRSIAAPFLTT